MWNKTGGKVLTIDAAGSMLEVSTLTLSAMKKAGVLHTPKCIFVIGGPGAGKGT